MGVRNLCIRAAAGLVALAAWPVDAGARPDARTMRCAEAQSLIERSGAAVVTTGPSTYERFVATAAYCIHGESLRPAWIATADERQCPIGWTCEDRFRRLRVR